jgi:hypothetical protein
MGSIVSLGENTNLLSYNTLCVEDNERRQNENIEQKKARLKRRALTKILYV